MHKKALIAVTRLFATENISWAVGGSHVLEQYGLVDSPADLDLNVHVDDSARAIEILHRVAEEVKVTSKEPFRTSYFKKYKWHGIEMDLMGGLAIQHATGMYRLNISQSTIKHTTIGNETVPFTTVEDWFVLYQLIPKKGEKAKLIETYWKENGVENPLLLQKALEQPLPDEIRKRIKNILS